MKWQPCVIQKVTSLSACLQLPKHMGHCTSLRMSANFTGINLQVSGHDVNSLKWLGNISSKKGGKLKRK